MWLYSFTFAASIDTFSITCCFKTPVAKIFHLDNNILNISQKESPTDVALTFINQYVKSINTTKGGKTPYDLVKNSKLVTANFKKRLKKMIDDANRKDPEMGLGFDPILNGQDYPEKGFELKNFDKKKNLVIVQGIDWPEFTITVKIVNIKGKWLVDGCGVVNIR